MSSEDYGVAVVRHKIKYSHLNDIFIGARKIFLKDQIDNHNNSILSTQNSLSRLKNEFVDSILLKSSNDGSEFVRSIAEMGIVHQITASKFVELNRGDCGIALGTRDVSTRLTRLFGEATIMHDNSLTLFRNIILNYDSVTRVVPNNITLAKAIKGRMASENNNVMDIVQSWTDFLMVWELNHSWYENP